MRRTSFVLLLAGVFLFGYGRGYLVTRSDAVDALRAEGYTEVQVTDAKRFLPGARGCLSLLKKAARFDADAIDSYGRRVKVYVCLGWPAQDPKIHDQ